MNAPIDLSKVRHYSGPLRTYRGFQLRPSSRKVLILDEGGIWGETPTVGEALKLIDRALGPVGPTAA